MAEKDDKLVYRYSRAERLERAPKAVREMEERKHGKKRGFFSFMRENRGAGIIMATIIAFTLFAGLFSIAQRRGGGGLSDYEVKTEARRSGGAVSLSIELRPQGLFALFGSEDADPIIVSTTASTDGVKFSRKDFAISGSGGLLSMDLADSGGDTVLLILGMNGKSVESTVPVKRADD